MSSDINKEIKEYIINLIYSNDFNINREMNLLNISYDVIDIFNNVKSIYKKTDIYNIELINKTDETIVRNLTYLYKEKFFDYIIFNNVLETLIDPWQILKYVKRYLKSDGYIIANINNLMNCKIIKSIINGTFSYSDYGIVDKKNIRLFTLLEIQKMFDSQRYKLNSILSVKLKEISEYDDIISILCNISDKSLKEQFQSYNYIVKASVKENKTLLDYVLNN